MKILKFLSLLMIFQAVVACTSYRYEYIPPQDPEGQKCIQSCINQKWTCTSNCHSDYSRCISFRGGINININSFGQPQPTQQDPTQMCDGAKSSCVSSCDRFYNDCYRSCGGMINIYEVN